MKQTKQKPKEMTKEEIKEIIDYFENTGRYKKVCFNPKKKEFELWCK